MAEVVNLNKARKAKQRADRTTLAAENRVKFGRTRQEKARQQAEEDRRLREAEGHRLDPVPDPVG